jgi:hypothetical protein
VEKRGEPLLLPLPCCFSYAVQRLGHAFPDLRPVRALLVPPSPRPPPFAPPPPRPAARLRSTASSLLWRGLTSRARSSPARAHRLPDADRGSHRPPGRTRDLSGSDVLHSCVTGSSTTAERQRLAVAALPMLPSALSTASASAMGNFRGSIAHPTRSLCTLRNRRHRRSRNTRYQAGATPYLGRTSTGWITSASPDALTVYSTARPPFDLSWSNRTAPKSSKLSLEP